MKIIVAEDEKVFLQFIVEALGAMAENVWTVDTLRGLQKGLSEHDVDAIWLDLSLLDSSAENTLRHLPLIRAQAPKATLIVCSGWGSTYQRDALRLGADAYSGKTEMGGLHAEAIAKLLSAAALSAIQRGAPANVILERVAAFVGEVAASRQPTPTEPTPNPTPP